MGKSSLIQNMIRQDIHQNVGLCLLDPHHDLTKAVIARLPEDKVNKVIVLDVLNEQYPFGLNLYQCDEPANSTNYRKSVTDTYEHIKHLFELLWGEGSARSLGPLISQGL